MNQFSRIFDGEPQAVVAWAARPCFALLAKVWTKKTKTWAGRPCHIFPMLAVTIFASMSAVARAQSQQPMMPSAGNENIKPAALDNVGIDQKLNAQIPADLVFNDETGKPVHLGDYYGKRPFVLALVYFKCPMLCTVVLNDLVRSLNAMNAMSVGKQFDVLTVSFDPTETADLAAAKKKQYIKAYGRDGAAEGWHFLTGSEASIKKLTDTVGFRYSWDPQYKQYIHASGLTILTPNGRVSRYFYGIDYDPMDLRLALDDAAGDKIGSVTEQVLLYCFHYDATTGKYGAAVDRLIKISAGATVLAIGTFLAVMFHRDPNRSRNAVSIPSPGNPGEG